MTRRTSFASVACTILINLALCGYATAQCTVPDNGGGTVTLPPAGCAYLSPSDVHQIVDGLPPGTTIELGAIHKDFICSPRNDVCSFPTPGLDCDQPGGNLGGEKECSNSKLALTLNGTGSLGGFSRAIDLPIDFETHVAPRTPGAPVQSFNTEMVALFGQITGDPDFDLLRITAGSGYGMPSPGHTTLTQRPGGMWAVDSFFDVFYRIDYVGAPGGHLAGHSGSTTGTIRMAVDGGLPCAANQDCDDNNACTSDTCQLPTCVEPGTAGTVALPPQQCGYVSPADVHKIINGLPPGTTIELSARHAGFFNVVRSPGGSLGGEVEQFSSSLNLRMNGSGSLAGYQRFVSLPIQCETHVGPRTPGAPVQSFDTAMFKVQGQISGDPDFDLLRITGGNAFGMPSPGHTTLTQLAPGSSYAVDSFFDITYRIDFVGRPGGPLGGMSGSTTATIRVRAAGEGTCVHTPATCDDGNPCTLDVCDPDTGACSHPPVDCDDANPCTDDSCDPAAGGCVHAPSNCNDDDPCTVDACVPFEGIPPECQVPDNGGGTVTLPPAGCAYLSPDEFHEIVDGLPVGTTIQIDAIHQGFACGGGSGQVPICSFVPPIPGVDCDQPGGTLGGDEECSESQLDLHLTGTGTLAGYDRQISLPIGFETHTGPRTPGQPVQSFDTDMFRLFGQTTGDPDFDLLRITAGTDFGLPSPGHTTLTQLPGGNWAVDSFFDITYRIDFVGRAGGPLSGRSGSTTGTIRMSTPNSHCTHTPADCNDNDPCTDDSCSPDAGCVHTPSNCNDDDPCTVDACVPFEGIPPECEVPDNGGGTVTLPPAGCAYLSPDEFHEIVDGLPVGTTIQIDAIHQGFACGGGAGQVPVCSFTPPIPGVDCDQPGGTLGGDEECSESQLELDLTGTGTLNGYSHHVSLGIGFETHTGPRTPGQPVQSFDTDMFRLFGQTTGDPDFDLLRIVAGTDFGLPSPGHTTLTQLPGGNWAVDSFFDITYRIDFVGKTGGPLSGRSGSTTGTIRMSTGNSHCTHTPVDCNDNNPCTLDSCDPSSGLCAHQPMDCSDGNVCTDDYCNPDTGQCAHGPVNCSDNNPCTIDSCVQLEGLPQGCNVPDNGGGTVTLPPAGCEYLSPDDVHEIVDGLPVGTTIELGTIHREFICHGGPAGNGVCSFPIPGNDCDQPGGSLGGEKECADSTLAMNLHGTGSLSGYNRTLNLPISFETHTAPRTPGQPIQSFDTDMFRLFGQVTGDPDFDLLRVVAGTDFGLPSPGHTTLRQQPGGNWAVDSFFDITYRIDFVGSAGGPLAGRSGSTTGTIRMALPPSGCAHTPVDCNDNNPCTLDSCNPTSGVCDHLTINCNDGIPCTVDSCNPANGQCVNTPVAPPPVSDSGVKFPNKITLTWPASSDASQWNTYRGSIPPVPYNHVCFESGDAQGNGATLTVDASNPLIGRLFYYLVSAENQCGESSLGRHSSGLPRPNVTPCP